jgi:chromosomal replication initiation ATPase DnaA
VSLSLLVTLSLSCGRLFKKGEAGNNAQHEFDEAVKSHFPGFKPGQAQENPENPADFEQSDSSSAAGMIRKLMRGSNEEMIVTSSRRSYAEQVLLAVECNQPVLLEGPAAVGKTALITALAMLRPDVKGDGLWRVNNTATTTIQERPIRATPT